VVLTQFNEIAMLGNAEDSLLDRVLQQTGDD